VPNKLKLEEVEAGLITLVSGVLGEDVHVEAVTDRNFDEQGALITKALPAALVMFDGEELQVKRDITRKTYQADGKWLIIVGARNLRDIGDERTDSLKMLTKLREGLAGQRPVLTSGDVTEPIELLTTERFQVNKEGTWHSLNIIVSGLVQY
jgi:phage gp37-like protein